VRDVDDQDVHRGPGRCRPTGLAALVRNLGLAILLASACGTERAPSANPAEPKQQLAEALLPAFELINERRSQEARVLIDALPGTDAGVVPYQVEFLLGYSFQREQLYAQAREHFLRAIQQEPRYEPSLHFLGFAQYYLGDLAAARRAFEGHLALRPDEGDDHFGIGLCDLDEGRLDEAARRFETAIELHLVAEQGGADRRRSLSSSYARLGDVCELRDDLPAARRDYEHAVTLWPAHYEVWHKLSRTLERLGESDLAATARLEHDAWRARVTGER
jgi:tetratricopeptide (TPR) repeat protein